MDPAHHTLWYRIKNWDLDYEPSRAKDQLAGPLHYVQLRAHAPARTQWFQRLERLAGERVMTVFGVFCRVLELAANQPRGLRGWLLDSNHRLPKPLDPAVGAEAELCLMLGIPGSDWEMAKPILTALDVLEYCDFDGQGRRGTPGDDAGRDGTDAGPSSSDLDALGEEKADFQPGNGDLRVNGREGTGRDGKGREGTMDRSSFKKDKSKEESKVKEKESIDSRAQKMILHPMAVCSDDGIDEHTWITRVVLAIVGPLGVDITRQSLAVNASGFRTTLQRAYRQTLAAGGDLAREKQWAIEMARRCASKRTPAAYWHTLANERWPKPPAAKAVAEC